MTEQEYKKLVSQQLLISKMNCIDSKKSIPSRFQKWIRVRGLFVFLYSLIGLLGLSVATMISIYLYVGMETLKNPGSVTKTSVISDIDGCKTYMVRSGYNYVYYVKCNDGKEPKVIAEILK